GRDLQDNNVGRAIETLEGSLPEMRHWEYYYLRAACDSQMRLFKGHGKAVRGVVFTPDNRRLVSGSDDKNVRVWDVASGKPLVTPPGHTAGVTSVACSPDGQRLASASDDKTVKVRNASDGQEITTFRGHTTAVKSVAFSPTGQHVVSGGDDRLVK